MSRKEDTAYEEWKQELRSKMTDDQKAHFDALVDTDPGREIFRGGIRENYLYTRLNEHKAKEEEFKTAKQKFEDDVKRQHSWFEAEKPKNEKLFGEVQRLQKQLKAYEKQFTDAGLDVPDELKAAQEATKRASTMDNGELDNIRQRLVVMDKALPVVIGKAMNIAARIVKDNYEITPDQVFQHAAEKGVDLDRAFYDLTEPERTKRAQTDLDAKIAKAKEEGAREALAKMSGPDRVLRSGPSIVETLRSGKAPEGVITNKAERVDAAVQDFMNLKAE